MNNGQCIFVICFHFWCIFLSDATFFSNPLELRDFFRKELSLMKQLQRSPVNATARFHSYAKKFQPVLDEFVGEENVTIDMIDLKLVHNPVHVFTGVRRVFEGEKEFFRWVQIEFPTLFPDVHDQLVLPSQEDVAGALLGLSRIQFTYRLPVQDLMMGLIRGHQTKARIDFDDVFAIVNQTLEGTHKLRGGQKEPDYALALDWLEGALVVLNRNGNYEEIDQEVERKLRRKVVEVMKEHNKAHGNSTSAPRKNEYERFYLWHYGSGRTGKSMRQAEKEVVGKMKWKVPTGNFYRSVDFYSLCRGDALNKSVPPKYENLKCSNIDRNDPYLKLRPIKAEVISDEPGLYMLHDFLSDSEIERLQKEAFMKGFDQAAVTTKNETVLQKDGSVGAKSVVSQERTQSTLWVYDNNLLYNEYELSKRVGLFVDLETVRPEEKKKEDFIEAEAWQMGLYSPGGVYLPHQDAFESRLYFGHTEELRMIRGNRIATFMVYLSEPDGGGTAFTSMGVLSPPRRGAAAFWYNMFSDGTKDKDSIHGACPPAFGVKWVFNKWIRMNAQMFKKPCHLQENQRYSF